MMDYEKAKADALQQKTHLTERQQKIAEEKARLDDEIQSIQRQLIGLEQIIEGLDVATLQAPPDLEPPNFTDHIKAILQQTTVHLLPTQIRDSCYNVGFKGSSLKNLLISVHNVLNRIHANLEEKQIEGKTAYKWKAEPKRGTLTDGLSQYAPVTSPGVTPSLRRAVGRNRLRPRVFGKPLEAAKLAATTVQAEAFYGLNKDEPKK